jgi:hypothetical protein
MKTMLAVSLTLALVATAGPADAQGRRGGGKPGGGFVGGGGGGFGWGGGWGYGGGHDRRGFSFAYQGMQSGYWGTPYWGGDGVPNLGWGSPHWGPAYRGGAYGAYGAPYGGAALWGARHGWASGMNMAYAYGGPTTAYMDPDMVGEPGEGPVGGEVVAPPAQGARAMAPGAELMQVWQPRSDDEALLDLDVLPRDAAFYVDDQLRGHGGYMRVRLGPGVHRVEIIRPGYRSEVHEVELGPGDAERLEIELAKP